MAKFTLTKQQMADKLGTTVGNLNQIINVQYKKHGLPKPKKGTHFQVENNANKYTPAYFEQIKKAAGASIGKRKVSKKPVPKSVKSLSSNGKQTKGFADVMEDVINKQVESLGPKIDEMVKERVMKALENMLDVIKH